MAPKVPRYDIHPGLETLQRLDASESLNLRKALQHVRARTYDKKFPEFKGRSLVPVDNSVDTADTSVAFDSYTEVGEAEITGDYGTEAPSVDTFATTEAQLIRGIMAKYVFNIQELRAATKANSRLPVRKANAARRAIEQVHDRVMLLGDAKWGLSGLFTLSGTNTYTVPLGVGGSKAWATKTSDEVLADLNGIFNQGVNDTNEVETFDTIVMPITAKQYIMDTRMGDGIDGTILDFFLKSHEGRISVETSLKLQSAPAAEWTGRRMVCYRKDIDALAAVIPQEFEQFAPQTVGMVTQTIVHSRLGGVQVFFPKSITYGDEI